MNTLAFLELELFLGSRNGLPDKGWYMGLLICVGLHSNSTLSPPWWIPSTRLVTLSPAFTSYCVLGNLKSDDYKSGLRGLYNESHSRRFHMEKKWGKEVLSSGLCQLRIQPHLHPNRLCDLVHVSLHFQVWLLIFKRRIIIYQFTYFLQWLKETIPVKTWHSKYSWVLFPQSNEQIPSACL